MSCLHLLLALTLTLALVITLILILILMLILILILNLDLTGGQSLMLSLDVFGRADDDHIAAGFVHPELRHRDVLKVGDEVRVESCLRRYDLQPRPHRRHLLLQLLKRSQQSQYCDPPVVVNRDMHTPTSCSYSWSCSSCVNAGVRTLIGV